MSVLGATDRRHFLTHVAGASALTVPGLTFLTDLRSQAATLKKNGKTLIVLWMGGGPSTIDLWDMKPDSQNGGSHKPVSTSADGVKISEHLPKIGKVMKHLSIVRSLTTSEGDHNRGTFLMSTGRPLSPLSEFPHIGSVLSYQLSQDTEAMKNMDLPAFIAVGGSRVGPGFLGMRYAPFTVQNAGSPPENVSPPGEVANLSGRMERRKVLFDTLEGGFKTNVAADAAQAHKDVYGKALQLVTSSRKDVFTFNSQEQALLKSKYGESGFGRGCLLAKKLVEAGVACVEVSLGGWDMHNGIFASLTRPNMLPAMDQGMSAMVDDLAQSGRLKDTVIVWMGEFGRTPRINQNAGRDHFPRAWSVVVGGGAIKGGVAYGSTNADGTEVKDNPVKIGDRYATLAAGLGLSESHGDIRDNLGRPRSFAANPVPGGSEAKASPIKGLVG
ncbi:MAG: DUF1501 domain-containing protein [Gemmataceae bacterium]